MFTPDQAGRPASPHPDLPKSVCGACAVCKTRLNSSSDPKLLPCLHTVCQACITKTYTDECTHECPMCEQSFRLFEVTECVIFEDSSHNNEPLKCSGCEENEVSGWCVQCEEALCLDCVSAHHRVKVTRDHEVIPRTPPTGWMQRRRCPSHKQESLKFFCLVCNELTCRDCQLITHRGHSFMQEEEAVRYQRQQLQSLLASIKQRKETVNTSLQRLETRLRDIEVVKIEARKRITQVVHSIYQTLILRAKEILNEIEALYAEEVKSLMLRKISLNRIEGSQDYITAFIDKILSTEGHCLLVHKKRIETQVKKLLSQKTCPPETMIELHLQFQKELLESIKKWGLMRVKKVPVPFTCSTIGSNPSVSEKDSNPPSERINSNSPVTAIDASASSSSLQESTTAQSISPSSKTHSKPHLLPKMLIARQINNTSQSANPGKTWTVHYYPAMQVSIQTPMQTHAVPTIPTNTQTSILANPISTNKQTPVLLHPILANNQISGLTQPIPANNQTALNHPNPVKNQTSLLTQAMLAIPTATQSPVLTCQIPVNNQTPILTHSVPVNKQTPVLTHLIPANNQTLKLNHPVSNIPNDTQKLVLNHPMITNILGHVRTFATQPNSPLTIASTRNNSHTSDLSKLNLSSPACNTIPSTTSNSSIPLYSTQSAPIGGNDTFQSQKILHHSTDPKANLTVKALADSACDQEPGVSSTNFTDMDHPEINLPTSTVPENDPEEPLPAIEKDTVNSVVPSNTHQAPLTTTNSTDECSLVRSSHSLLRSPPKGGQAQTKHSSTGNYSKPKRWSDGMPTSFRQLLEGTHRPFSLIDNLNAKSVNSTPCSTSEGIGREVTTQDKTVQSDFYQMMSRKEDVESAVMLEHTKQFKRFLRVTLVRLPISLPPCGQPLPQFRLTTDSFADHILVQETQGGQIKQLWRWQEDLIQPRASPLPISQNIDSPLVSEVQFCAVCQSAGAAHLCAKCGRAFHSDCHIPPIFIIPCEEWMCLLCQDINDENIVYGSKQMMSSLSPQDQRKCEKLLLSLLCDENRCLLYSATKHRSKTAEFDIVLGRFLGKRKPPYRTAAELVSDVWTLFDILITKPERRDLVVRLQTSFQQQLNESFGKSLHASLLRYSSDSNDKESRNTSDTQTEKEKHKKTLKRMRQFFSTNCGTATKKHCTEREGCGNPTANDH
ncbi:transcription intermediary factor 1-beta isoform X2 [Myxocyprinus asiaticus]|uniref:transcription intermediary factor 1-beta isoform X2 n=1 Tax=Myxocyprinus asiaticus TaxID=70543 RepID=UPI002222627D|nr:transcription intermediary factor 1-beta isoform X2 [Myxocyprinus asiaticus]